MKLILAVLLSACAAVEFTARSEVAREGCLEMFSAFDRLCERCAAECRSPNVAICERATRVDDEKLRAVCLPWLESAECVYLSPDDFRAHCTVITFLDL